MVRMPFPSATVPVLSLLSLAILGCGQAKIVGKVVDDKGGAVQAAQIETDPPTDFIITNQNGFFVIDRHLDDANQVKPLQPREYRIRIKKLGYTEKVVPVKVEGRSEYNLGEVVLKQKRIDMRLDDDLEDNQDGGPGAGDLGPVHPGE